MTPKDKRNPLPADLTKNQATLLEKLQKEALPSMNQLRKESEGGCPMGFKSA